MTLELPQIQKLYKQMPFRTLTTVGFPYPFGPFPKHFPTAYNKAAEKWLDNYSGYLTTQQVEEWIAKQKIPMVQGASQKTIIANLDTLHGAIACTQGSELEVVTTDSAFTNSSDFVVANSVSATIDECYDELAAKTEAATTLRMAVYDDNSDPNNLETETDVNEVGAATYVYNSTTEFDTATAKQWIAENFKPAGGIRRTNSGDAEFVAHTFGTFPDPIGAIDPIAWQLRMKMRHS